MYHSQQLLISHKRTVVTTTGGVDGVRIYGTVLIVILCCSGLAFGMRVGVCNTRGIGNSREFREFPELFGGVGNSNSLEKVGG